MTFCLIVHRANLDLDENNSGLSIALASHSCFRHLRIPINATRRAQSYFKSQSMAQNANVQHRYSWISTRFTYRKDLSPGLATHPKANDDKVTRIRSKEQTHAFVTVEFHRSLKCLANAIDSFSGSCTDKSGLHTISSATNFYSFIID